MTYDKNNENETNLSGASEDSGTGIKFEEKYRIERSYDPKTPKITRWVIKHSGGLVKNENQANYILIGFVVLAFIVSLFLLFGSDGNKGEPPKIPSSPFESP